jgi:hypothetical protein
MRREVTGRLAEKLLTPIVAAAASAAAGYVAKKAPEIFERKVQPAMRNAKKSAADLEAPSRAKDAAGDLASGLAERAKAVAGGGSAISGEEDIVPSPSRGGGRERAERAHRRQERAERRAARRKRSKA